MPVTTNCDTVAPLNQYVTEDEIAESLRLSKRQITNLRQRRLIPFLKIGRSVRFSPTEVNRALSRLTVAAS